METPKPHPIQLKDVAVIELLLKKTIRHEQSEKRHFTINRLTHPFNSKDRTITFGMRLTHGMKEEEKETTDFQMVVEIVALFQAMEESLKEKDIVEWADNAAQFILIPYLRMYSNNLAVNAGMAPIILPLVQVPTQFEQKE